MTNNEIETDVLILGAGPAGLSAARTLKKDFLILEKNDSIGGLCRSFEFEGCTFDLGGHAFFTTEPESKKIIKKYSTVRFYEQLRSAWVYSYGNFIKYPFQSNLFGLPTTIVRECISGLVQAMLHSRKGQKVRNLEEWILKSFGEGMARHFLIPYNEKVWAHDLKKVFPTWVSARIVTPSFDRILKGALEKLNVNDYVNGIVNYPNKGGFQNIYVPFADKRTLGRISFNEELLELDIARRTVRTGSRTIKFKHLISTMPLDLLTQRTPGIPRGLLRSAKDLKHNSEYLVNLVFSRKYATDMQRLYSADRSDLFHKMVFNNNSSAYLRKNSKHFGIQAEVSFSREKKVDPRTLVPSVVKSLNRMGIVKGRPKASKVVRLEYAYPVYTQAGELAKAKLIQYFEDKKVFCAGRFGEWIYINSDKAILRGKAAAEKINQV